MNIVKLLMLGALALMTAGVAVAKVPFAVVIITVGVVVELYPQGGDAAPIINVKIGFRRVIIVIIRIVYRASSSSPSCRRMSTVTNWRWR